MNNSSNKTFEPDLIQGVNIIALELGNLQFDESVLIITDHETEFLGEIFEKILIVKKYSINHISIQPLKSHGESLPEHISKLMNSYLIFSRLLVYLLFHQDGRSHLVELVLKQLAEVLLL